MGSGRFVVTSALESSRSLRSPFPNSCPCSSCSPVGLQRLGRTPASRVQDELMLQHTTSASAALASPM
eukprot:1607671-Prymnesium_polylepis.1